MYDRVIAAAGLLPDVDDVHRQQESLPKTCSSTRNNDRPHYPGQRHHEPWSVRSSIWRAIDLVKGWIGQNDGRRYVTDACHNKGRLVHVALLAALVGDNGVGGDTSQCPVRLWLE